MDVIILLLIAVSGFLLYYVLMCSSLQKSVVKLKKMLGDKNTIIKNKQDEIVSLKEEIEQIKTELEDYKSIKEDSLNLNVEDEEASIGEEVEEVKEEKPKSDLNEEKTEIFKIMNNTNNNLFVTGKAGTGKSYLLKYFRAKTTKRVLYCAPTGIAALNINGVTLHSVFGFKNLIEDSEIKLSANKIAMFKKIDTIVIDEVSMVRVDVFNQVDKIMRFANVNNLPFGGKQVILFGDLFQLPPVASKGETEFLTDKYGGIFFFNSPAYNNGNFIFKELQDIFRQTDKEFIDILNDIRVGKINNEQISSLNKHYVKDVPRRVVQVVPKKSEANEINKYNLDRLGSNTFNYKAQVLLHGDDFKETDFPCDFDLKLKVGALVMMITNDQEKRRWVNGTLGIISNLSPTMIKVTINGVEYEISPVAFEKYKCEYDKENKKLKYIVDSSVSQFPLILAYAITIHKSQGMTYQQIACNLDNCFAPGQAYVALSRCANYDKLFLTSKVEAKQIITDNVVANFYNSVKNK